MAVPVLYFMAFNRQTAATTGSSGAAEYTVDSRG
jgi:hypothetical protein